MPSERKTGNTNEHEIQLQTKSTGWAFLFFATIVRASLTLLAASIYYLAEHVGLPVLPIDEWLLLTTEELWRVELWSKTLFTIALIWLIYWLTSGVNLLIMLWCFEATPNFRRFIGYEYIPDRRADAIRSKEMMEKKKAR